MIIIFQIKSLVEVYVMKVGVELRGHCMEHLQILCSLCYPSSLSYYATLQLFENWGKEQHIDQEQQGNNAKKILVFFKF